MNSNEIFEEYTKATSKSRFTKDKAAELGVKESDIICELLKSGYKFEELKRANKGTYNAGMNKFKKWQENGSPEDEDADALAQYTEPAEEERPEYVYPATDEPETTEDSEQDLMKIIAELRNMNAKLQLKNESLENQVHTLEIHCENLEADNQMLSKQYAELEMMSKKIEKDAAIDAADLKSEQEHLDKIYQENERLKKRLEKAERYILNTIYAQSEDGVKE